MSTGTMRYALSPAWQRGLMLILLLLFVGLSVLSGRKTLDGSRSAISRWQPQLLHLDEGQDIWAASNFPNPPIAALLLRPLAGLPPLACALTWFYLKVGMTLLGIYWAFQIVAGRDGLFPPWAKVTTVVLSLRPIMGDLLHGNINLFIMFLVIAALYAFQRGRGLLSGHLLALAIACKLTPALFIPYLIWKRAWSALVGCLIGLVLFLGVVPACFLGWNNNARDLQSWVERMIVPFVIEGKVTSEHNNQSLPGLLYRLGTDSPSFSTFDEDEHYVPLEHHNLVTLDPSLVRWALKGCMLLFAALVVWTCRTPTSLSGQSWRLAAEFSIVLLGMLLFSERTWKHHCVTLVLPFAVLCYYLFVCQPGQGLQAHLIGSLLAVLLLMASTSTGLLPANAAKLAQVYGAYVWANLILLTALIVLLRVDAASQQCRPCSAADCVL